MRPKTLPAAVVPVLVGASLAFRLGQFQLGPTLAALFGALLLQIGSNFANDVFDFEKGADTDARVGPTRAVQAGLITPKAMRRALFVVFGLAVLTGVYLTLAAGWWIVVIGVASILAAIAYTGGPYPLGYHGLGDVFVLVFFGFVAVGGTVFVNTGGVPVEAWWHALAVGSLATAILVVNNVRDVETDRVAGKRTLVVRLGRAAGVGQYRGLLFLAYLCPLMVVAWHGAGAVLFLPWLTLPWAFVLQRSVAREQGATLNRRLAQTAQLLLVFGVLLAAGLVLDRPTSAISALAQGLPAHAM